LGNVQAESSHTEISQYAPFGLGLKRQLCGA
jgi:hypothetical protein